MSLSHHRLLSALLPLLLAAAAGCGSAEQSAPDVTSQDEEAPVAVERLAPLPGASGGGADDELVCLAAPGQCGILYPNQALTTGEYLQSCDGRFTLAMQGDGNLVLYMNTVGPLWSTQTSGTNANDAIMQNDGNFVLYNQPSGHYFWYSVTQGFPGAYLRVQNDGNLVVYYCTTPLWWTGTSGH